MICPRCKERITGLPCPKCGFDGEMLKGAVEGTTGGGDP